MIEAAQGHRQITGEFNRVSIHLDSQIYGTPKSKSPVPLWGTRRAGRKPKTHPFARIRGAKGRVTGAAHHRCLELVAEAELNLAHGADDRKITPRSSKCGVGGASIEGAEYVAIKRVGDVRFKDEHMIFVDGSALEYCEIFVEVI